MDACQMNHLFPPPKVAVQRTFLQFFWLSQECAKNLAGWKKKKTSRVVWSHEETDILNLINTDEKNSGMPPFATTKADPARTAIFRNRVY